MTYLFDVVSFPDIGVGVICHLPAASASDIVGGGAGGAMAAAALSEAALSVFAHAEIRSVATAATVKRGFMGPHELGTGRRGAYAVGTGECDPWVGSARRRFSFSGHNRRPRA